MTVGELQGRMSYQELLEWSAFYVWEAKERKRQERDANRRSGRRG